MNGKFFLSLAIALPAMTWASERQDLSAIRSTVESYLHTQAAGLSGQVDISVGVVDARLNLPACEMLEPTLPKGSRPWGKTTVMVRCLAPASWTVYVSAMVKVMGSYFVSAKPLALGQTITQADLVAHTGDLTQMPAGIITDSGQAVGKVLVSGITSGSPLRQDMLRAMPVVIQNQAVKLVSEGNGFKISSEGKALNNATEGQLVQVRIQSGQVISGIAHAGGVIAVSY